MGQLAAVFPSPRAGQPRGAASTARHPSSVLWERQWGEGSFIPQIPRAASATRHDVFQMCNAVQAAIRAQLDSHQIDTGGGW